MRLQFSTESGVASEAIRAFDHGWCSHVDAVLLDGTLLGARADGGVRIRPPGYAPFTRTLIVDLPSSRGGPMRDADFYGFLRNQLGELQAAALEQCGYFEFPLATPRNRVTPSDLLLALSATMNIPAVSYMP